VRQVLQDNNRLIQLIVISPAPPYDNESDDDDWCGFGLFG
jgi:hypothetical protein